MVAIYWTHRDLLVSLAGRLAEFEGSDSFDLLDKELTPSAVGVTQSELEEIADEVSGVLEDMSITKGWEILDGTLDYLFDAAWIRVEAGEHPNSPKPEPNLPS